MLHIARKVTSIFFFNNKKFSLNPLTPSEVYECQVHLKKEFDNRRMDNKIESEKASNETKFEKPSNSKSKSISSNSIFPKTLHVHKQEEIEEIVRKSSSTKRSLCLHVKNEKESNLFPNLSLKVFIPNCFLTNFVFSYLPTQIVIILQTDNSYQEQLCEVECSPNTSNTSSLAIIPFKVEHSNDNVYSILNCSNFTLRN